jgi:hypothetical protein
MSNTALTAILAGLAGIVLTGGIQTGVSIANRLRQARTAARLLYMDLWWAGLAMGGARRRNRWNPLIDWEMFTSTWPTNREPLATVLGTEDFLAVSAAFMAIDHLRRIRAADLAEQSSQVASPHIFNARDQIETYRAYVQRAMLIVHRASFTWRERSDGGHLLGQEASVGSPPSAPEYDVSFLGIAD